MHGVTDTMSRNRTRQGPSPHWLDHHAPRNGLHARCVRWRPAGRRHRQPRFEQAWLQARGDQRCAGLLRWKGRARAVSCDAPTYAQSTQDRPVVITTTPGTQPSAGTAALAPVHVATVPLSPAQHPRTHVGALNLFAGGQAARSEATPHPRAMKSRLSPLESRPGGEFDMGIQDRDYYREHHQKLQEDEGRSWYDPKLFRGGGRGSPPTGGLPDLLGAHWPYPFQIALWVVVALAFYGVYKLIQGPVSTASAPHAAAYQPEPVPALAVPVERPVPPDPDRARRVENVARMQALAAQREHAEAAAEAKRKAAWASYFQPSPWCRENSATVDCANEYIRARRGFDSRHR